MTNPEIISHEPQLDIRKLCRALWYGKLWIAGFGCLFAIMAFSFSALMKQQWGVTVVIDKPVVDNMVSYYAKQQFLRNLDARLDISLVDDPLTVVEKAYNEFIVQLAAWDTRRDFWLMTDYYKQRQKNEETADVKLLDELINSIQFIPRDDKKMRYDRLKLVAETASDAFQLLQQYVEFTRQRSVGNLNGEAQVAWNVRTQWMNERVKWQKTVAWDLYHRKLNGIQQALQRVLAGHGQQKKVLGEQDAITQAYLTQAAELQVQFDLLKATGPNFDMDYSQNQAILAILTTDVVWDNAFQTYRYLRAPQRPVESDSPRRIFLLMMWGSLGALVGAGVALIRCVQRQ